MQTGNKKEVVTMERRTYNHRGEPIARDDSRASERDDSQALDRRSAADANESSNPSNAQAGGPIDSRTAAFDGESLSDPREALRLIEHQSRRVGRMFNVFHWKFCLVWGLSWLIGYGVLGFSTRAAGGVTPGWAWGVGAALLVGAVAISVIVGLRGVSGYKSSARAARDDSRRGAIYGWTWFLGFFFGMGGLGSFVNRFALPDDASSILFNMVAILLVGVLYMAGGALWGDLSQLIVGVWMIVIVFVLPMLDVVTGFFIMAFLGGGAMLLMALWAVTLGNRNAAFAALMGGR
jgi:hypothetical protein